MNLRFSYLDETLKRLPLIVIGCTGLWYGINKLNSIENKIEKIELLSFKDKEIIDAKINNVILMAQSNDSRTTEIEKDIIRILAILPSKIEIKNEDNN